ncbi:hypothetical protein ACFQ61_34740 [Streptomyces sp. NPDC056500]|uniref:hypothetical protein n=1 Tax=Streptomyces sp. NPDC056500 TaxID=3345840 RepID=UPI00369BB34C
MPSQRPTGRAAGTTGAGDTTPCKADAPYGELAEFYQLIDTVLARCQDFQSALASVEDSLVELRAIRRPGPPPVVLGGYARQAAWADFSAAFRALNGAVTLARAEGYRAAVDDGGLTLTELARVAGHSRQQVTRLVNRGRDSHRAGPQHPTPGR